MHGNAEKEVDNFCSYKFFFNLHIGKKENKSEQHFIQF